VLAGAIAAALQGREASAATRTQTFAPVADSYVSARHGRANFGTARLLKMQSVPRQRVFLRFELHGVAAGAIARATLELQLTPHAPGTVVVRRVRGASSWKERSLTFRRGPSLGPVVAAAKARRGTRRLAIDVTDAVESDAVELVLTTRSRHGLAVRSRETKRGPALRVRTTIAADGGREGGGPLGVTGPAQSPVDPEPAQASVFVAQAGSDANSCTADAPCQSFQRAYLAALPGQVVEVAAGAYPSQSVGEDATKSGGPVVVFRPARGAAVVLDELAIEGASWMTIRGMRVVGSMAATSTDAGAAGSHHVTFDSMTAPTIRIVGPVSDITVRGGSFGGTVDNQPQVKKYNQGDPDSSRPRNILIDGAYFHDYLRSGSSVHTECFQVINVDTLTIRNSRFDNCDGTGDIGITDGPHDNITLENNFLGKAGDAFYAMQVTKNIRNFVMRNNSASKAVIFSDAESGGPYLLEGNYMPYSACTSGVTYRHNVFQGATCGPTDLGVAAMRFVDENGFDLHLAAGSEAIGRGNPAGFPATDIDGQSRPLGGTPDAGADERG
jgi:hypothetical protein